MDAGVEMQMLSTVSLSAPYVTQSRLREGELWRTDSRVKWPFLSHWKPSEVRQEPRAHQGYPESKQSWSRYGFQAAVNLQEVKAEPGDVWEVKSLSMRRWNRQLAEGMLVCSDRLRESPGHRGLLSCRWAHSRDWAYSFAHLNLHSIYSVVMGWRDWHENKTRLFLFHIVYCLICYILRYDKCFA